MKPPRSTPRYRMPAEWEPHNSTWLAWPHYRGDWPGKFEPIPWVYAEIIRHLGRYERIDMIVRNPSSEKQARKVLAKANAVLANFHQLRRYAVESGQLPTVKESLAALS